MNQGAHFITSVAAGLFLVSAVNAYPPAVGILSKSKNCMSCHVNNGNWQDGPKLIIDIVDKETGQSLKQSDGSFLLTVKRWQAKTVNTVIGYETSDTSLISERNAWLYIDTTRLISSSLSKFPIGWEVNLPMACRLPGDKYDTKPDLKVTVLPMTVRPTDNSASTTVILQVMLTRGKTVKGNAKQGLIGNYFERTVRLEVVD